MNSCQIRNNMNLKHPSLIRLLPSAGLRTSVVQLEKTKEDTQMIHCRKFYLKTMSPFLEKNMASIVRRTYQADQ